MHLLSAHHELKSWGQTSEAKKILAIGRGTEAPLFMEFQLVHFHRYKQKQALEQSPLAHSLPPEYACGKSFGELFWFLLPPVFEFSFTQSTNYLLHFCLNLILCDSLMGQKKGKPCREEEQKVETAGKDWDFSEKPVKMVDRTIFRAKMLSCLLWEGTCF